MVFIRRWFFAGYIIMNMVTLAFGQQKKGGTGTILLQSNFEKDKKMANWSKETCRMDAITLNTKIVRKGKYSARFEFTKNDPINYKGYVRAELKQDFTTDPTGENWYAFSNFFPDDYNSDPLPEVVAQWHEIPDWNLGEDWRSPPISLEIKDDSFYVKVLWASATVNTNKTKDGQMNYNLGPVDKNKWNDWVFHIKFRYDDTGILEVYKNKTKILTRNGPNSYNDQNFPYFKLGIYKWGWSSQEWASISPENKRVLFIDEIKVGNRHSNLDKVSPH